LSFDSIDGTERWRTPLDGYVYDVAIDGNGDVIAAGYTQVIKLRGLTLLSGHRGPDPLWQHLEAVRLMREYYNKNPREVHVALRIAEIYEKVRTPDVDWSQRPETPASVEREPIPVQQSASSFAIQDGLH